VRYSTALDATMGQRPLTSADIRARQCRLMADPRRSPRQCALLALSEPSRTAAMRLTVTPQKTLLSLWRRWWYRENGRLAAFP
jgi:hypothetical protein